MKINILPVPHYCQPTTQGFIAPPGNHDFGVEQDFHNYLLSHQELLTIPQRADWYYLPIYWNRYYILNDWGSGKLDELHQAVDRALDGIDGERVFTVCEYDLFALSKGVNLRGGLVMCSSKRGDGRFIDIPLLRSRHHIHGLSKWIYASFAGNTQTDGIRSDMELACSDMPNVICNHEFREPDAWAKMIESSYIALAPRGQGASSFRFYEAMQLGTVPMHIGAPDVRPFKNNIPWEACSFYIKDVDEMVDALEQLRSQEAELAEMGKNAQVVYDNQLGYGKWCKFALQELEMLG